MIRFNHPSDGYAIANETVPYNPASDTVIARVQGGRLLGGVLLQNFTGASITMHVSGFDTKWLCRDMLWVSFHYPFVQLGCKKVLGFVSSGNPHAIDFDLRMGFTEEARIKDVYPDGDLVLMSMRREDCRWLTIKPKGIGVRTPDG